MQRCSGSGSSPPVHPRHLATRRKGQRRRGVPALHGERGLVPLGQREREDLEEAEHVGADVMAKERVEHMNEFTP